MTFTATQKVKKVKKKQNLKSFQAIKVPSLIKTIKMLATTIHFPCEISHLALSRDEN